MDEKTNETLHINDNRPLKAASYVTGSQTNNLDAITSQDNARDRKLASSVDQLPLYSSDPEINTLDQGSVRELSTFTPTKENVFGETTEEWSIRLNKTDVNACFINILSFSYPNKSTEIDANRSV